MVWFAGEMTEPVDTHLQIQIEGMDSTVLRSCEANCVILFCHCEQCM